MDAPMEHVEKAAEILASSRYAIAFTGAGVSTESGIPDFRGPDGLWRRMDPEKFHIEYFTYNPDEVWRLIVEHLIPVGEVKPNPAHYSIARLEEIGIIRAVITQNIDGLHQRAGSKRVIELHGNSRWSVCTLCGHRVPIEDALRMYGSTNRAPSCPRCGGILKPDVVFFGEPLPRRALSEAFDEARRADAVLVVGSSLVVTPAAYIPLAARESGARIVIVNLEPTTMDDMADVVIRSAAGRVLPRILEHVEARLT